MGVTGHVKGPLRSLHLWDHYSLGIFCIMLGDSIIVSSGVLFSYHSSGSLSLLSRTFKKCQHLFFSGLLQSVVAFSAA